MGRYDKPHHDLHMRFDWDIYVRLRRYVDGLNQMEKEKGTRLTTITEIVEEAVFQYLNEKES